MKKNIYLLLVLINLEASMAAQNNFSFFSRLLGGIGLSALVSNKAKRDVPKKPLLS